MISRLCFLVSFLMCGALVCGCTKQDEPKSASGSASGSAPDSGSKVLRLNIQTNPLSMDPRVGGDRRCQVITKMLFEGLTRMAPDGQAQLSAAKSVTLSPDNKTYTFVLREAQWTDGRPLTAHDFEYAWKKALTPDFDTHMAYMFFPIFNAKDAKLGEVSLDEVGIRAIDDQTLEVKLEFPAPYFFDLLSNAVYSPAPTGIYEERPNWAHSAQTYVSNGPYSLVSQLPDEEIVVTKNQGYWDANSVALDGIRVSIVNDGISSMALFENGEIDWAGEPLAELPIGLIPKLKQEGKLETRGVSGVHWLSFNTKCPLFRSAKIRRALSYAIMRQELIDHLLQANESVAYSILPPSLSLQEEGLFEDGNVELARTLFAEGLEEVGLSKETLPPIHFGYSMVEGQLPLVQAIAQQWQRAFDLDVTLEGCEWTVYSTKLLGREFDVGGISWFSWFNDPTYNLNAFKYLDGYCNTSNWEHPRFTELLDRANGDVSNEVRNQYLKEAEKLITEEMPLAPIYVVNYRYVRQKGVEGVLISKEGLVDFKWARLNRDHGEV